MSTRKPDQFKNSTPNAIVDASSWFARCNWEEKVLSYIGLAITGTPQDWSQEIEITQSQRLINLASAEYSEDSELMRSLILAVESLAKKISLLQLSVGE